MLQLALMIIHLIVKWLLRRACCLQSMKYPISDSEIVTNLFSAQLLSISAVLSKFISILLVSVKIITWHVLEFGQNRQDKRD